MLAFTRLCLFLLASLALSAVAMTPVAAESRLAAGVTMGSECDPGMTAAGTDILLASSDQRQREGKSVSPTHQGSTKMKAAGSGPGKPTAAIAKGGCCGPVAGGCVSWCNKSGGCTGKGDCDTFKSN